MLTVSAQAQKVTQKINQQMNFCKQQLFLLSVTCEAAYFALGIAPIFIGNTPVFLNPLCYFATLMNSL